MRRTIDVLICVYRLRRFAMKCRAIFVDFIVVFPRHGGMDGGRDAQANALGYHESMCRAARDFGGETTKGLDLVMMSE